jgi:hypothetical protein
VTERTHHELEELLGAFSLDAVDPDEREAVEAHLAECPRCRAEVADLREVAGLLANSDAVAPEGLWDRIAEAIDEVPPPMRLDLHRPTRRSRSRPAAVALAAAAAVALLVLGWQVRDLRDQNDRIQNQLAAADATRDALNEANVALLEPNSRLARMNGSNGRAFAVLTGDGAGYLVSSDLPELDTGIYELWGADESGSVVPLGSTTRSGVTRFDAGGDVKELLVTVEPEFVMAPTTEPIMQGNLV